MAVRGMSSDVVDNWAQGVITSPLQDRLPDGALAEGRNTQFYNIGPQQGMLGTRMGMTAQNATALAGAIVSQHYINTNTLDVHVVTLAGGNVVTLSNGTPSTIGTGSFTVDDPVAWATFETNAYAVNGTDRLKTDGTGVTNFGIAQPASGAWSVAAGGSGGVLPAGDYRVVVTYVNSNTGHEGQQSEPKSVTIASGQQMTITLPSVATVGDSQVDYARIYIEQSGVRNDFFLLADGTTPAIGASGFALNASTTADVVFDVAQGSIDVFRTLAPGVNNNAPPPVGTRHVVARQQRLFVATATDVYWSDVGEPESFNLTDNTLPIGEDGEVITGLAVLEDALVIFKRNYTYALVGQSPSSWQVVLVDSSVGCTSHQSIGYADGRLWWMSMRGPRNWATSGSAIVDITGSVVADLFDEDAIDPDDLATSVVVVNPTDQYVGWAVTPKGSTVNKVIVPYHYILDRWMSSGWDVVDVVSAAVVQDTTGRGWPMIGDKYGFVYQLGTSTQDGVPSGQVATGTATSATSTTITDSTQTWTTNVFTGRYVVAYSPTTGIAASAQRTRITSNTATALTVTSWPLGAPSVGSVYVIGGILLDWKGAERNANGPFYRKRIEFLFLDLYTTAVGDTCQVLVYKDGGTSASLDRTLTIGQGDVWDVGLWGTAVWANRGFLKARIPIRTTGYSWQVRVLQLSSGKQLTVQRMAVQWLTKTKKVGQA